MPYRTVEKQEVISEIERTFPFIEKPRREDIPFHSDHCSHCEFTLLELDKYSGKELPEEAIRIRGQRQSKILLNMAF